MATRDPDLSHAPNKYAPANSLSFEDSVAHLRGYQDFTLEPRRGHLHPIGSTLIAKDAVVERAFVPRVMAGRTVLDLGGNNGFFAFKALAAGAASACVVDMDPECILNLHRVRSHFPELALEAHQQNSNTWDRPADVVLAFALVHWIYSCTGRALSLDRAIDALAALTREMLVIEWVDPADPVVLGHHHTEVADPGAAEPYHFEAFFRALSARFSCVEFLGELSPTRRIYLATRGQLPDLSWRAPLLYPRETLLSSKMLWAPNGVEFWSRVYRHEGRIYKQCTPELARREVDGAQLLGEAVEVLQRHEDWWLIRLALVDGKTLDERMARTPPSRDEILQLTLQLIDEVGRLKQVGAVHRDLHPANLIMDAEGRAHLIDFGWVQAPGMPDLAPDSLGMQVLMPATGTTIDVRPPESSGDDLFAVGRIAGWMNRARDPDVDFLAAWLGHPDQRIRLSDTATARQLALRLLGPVGGELRRSSDPEGAGEPFEQRLMQLSRRALEKISRLGEVHAGFVREREAAKAQQARLTAELAAAQARGRDLEQALATGKEERDRLALAREEANARGEAASRDLAAVRRELDSARQELAGARGKARAELARLATQLRQQEAELADLRQRWFQVPQRVAESAPSRWALGGIKTARRKLAATLPGRAVKAARSAVRGGRAPRDDQALRQRIADSGIFEPEWYLQQYPDVAQAGLDPLDHYLEHGGAEGRDPGPLFDGNHYLTAYPDLQVAGVNPLAHYLEHGAAEGRDPNPLFDTSYYLDQHPDVVEAGVNPLVHFATHGAAEGRRPNPIFDPAFYLRAYPDVAASGVNPLAHYLRHGSREGRRPSAEFDPSLAAMAQPEAAAAGATPLVSALAALQGQAPLEQLVLSTRSTRARPATSPREDLERLRVHPTVSLLLPTYNSDPRYLELAIASILAQSYPHWELHLSDDGSTSAATHAYLDTLAARDPRIHVQRHPKNRGISAATNAALAEATGEWVAMVDHDDELEPDALVEIVKRIDADPSLDAVYTDQDYIEADGRIAEPLLKPDWSLELFRGVMFVGHLLAVRRALAQEVGGFDSRFDKVQDFEFMLRIAERTRRIGHVPKILYHWRRIPGSVAFHGDEKGGIGLLQARAVTAHLQRCGVPAAAEPNPQLAHRAIIVPAARADLPRTTVILRCGAEMPRPERAVQALRQGRHQAALDVVAVDAGMAPEARAAMEALRIPIAMDGHPAAMGAGATTPLLLFLDADLVPATPGWLEHLALYAEMGDVACAAPLIVDEHGKVAEAGLVLGLAGPIGPVMRGLPAHADGYAGSLSCAREVTAVSGRCALVSREALAALGALRPAFATGAYRIADLALRAHLAGRRNIVVPGARFAGTAAAAREDLALDRALLGDAFAEAIAAGDPYYNPAFSRTEPGYLLD